MSANDFVKELVLPQGPEYEALVANLTTFKQDSHLRSLSSNEESAQVNAGSITSFVQGLEGIDKSDVMNSTLLAQLSANASYDRMKEPMKWYKYYIDVLENIGWNVPSFAFDGYSSGGTTVNLDYAVIDILRMIASSAELSIVKRSMAALESESDDSGPMRIWHANASGGNNGNFQIFPVAKVNGTVVMIMVGMEFQAHTQHFRFLWWTWESSKINITRAANRFELNQDVYKLVRNQIVEKLGERASIFVKDLPI